MAKKNNVVEARDNDKGRLKYKIICKELEIKTHREEKWIVYLHQFSDDELEKKKLKMVCKELETKSQKDIFAKRERKKKQKEKNNSRIHFVNLLV